MTISAHDLALNKRAEALAALNAVRRRIHKASELIAAVEALRIATEEVEQSRQPVPRKKIGATKA